MSVMTKKRRPRPQPPREEPVMRRRRYAEAPDRGELDARHREATEARSVEAPDAGEAALHEDTIRGFQS